MKILIEKLKRN